MCTVTEVHEKIGRRNGGTMSKGTQGGHRIKLAAISLARTLLLIQSWVPSQVTSPADTEVPRTLPRAAGCQEILASLFSAVLPL